MPFWSRFRNLLHDAHHSNEVDEELQFHLEMRIEDNLKAGMSAADAERDARLRFGNVTLQKERTREASILSGLDSLAQDLRYTLRSLRSGRGVSALIVAVLALGIGANTAIFSITHALLLRALPVKDAAGLINLRLGNFQHSGYIEESESLTYGQWKQVLERQTALRDLFVWDDTNFDVVLGGTTREVSGAFVTSGMFRCLGISPVAGRAFGASDERDVFSAPVALISYRLWEKEFAAAPAAIGRTITVEGKPFSIAGVMPPRFLGLMVGRAADLYVPLAAEPYIRGNDSAFTNPIRYFLMAFGRLGPGWTLERAQHQMSAISAPSLRATLTPEIPRDWQPNYLKQRFELKRAASGLSTIRTMLELPLTILTAIASLLLLLACFTVANLLLARGTARQKETAVRIAMGAPRGRILRQSVLESLLLALAGAGAGLVLSRALAVLLVRATSTATMPLFVDLSFNWTVFGFACGAATLSAVLFGLAPALRAAHIAPADAFKGGSATISGSVMRMRRLLLAAQIAVTVVLIAGGVLFGATLRNLLTIETGFRSDSLTLANVDLRRTPLGSVDLRRNPVSPEARRAFYTRLFDRLKAIPLADSASLCYMTPIANGTWQFDIRVDGQSGWHSLHTYFNAVSSDFFATFKTRIVAGRGFTERDSGGAPPVALVNSTFARSAFGKVSPIGRRILLNDPKPRTLEIVGLVEDAKYRDLREPVPPTLYVPFLQDPEPPSSLSFALHSAGPAAAVVREVNTVLSTEFPNLSFRLTTMREKIDDSLAQERVFTVVCALFGGLALCLAAVGIYGVLSYFIEQRRPEFGIRIAVGATPANLRRLIYAQAFASLAAGGALGCVAALWSARFIRGVLYGVTAAQPAVYAIAIGILALVAFAATLAPAIRASRVSGMSLLRCE